MACEALKQPPPTASLSSSSPPRPPHHSNPNIVPLFLRTVKSHLKAFFRLPLPGTPLPDTHRANYLTLDSSAQMSPSQWNIPLTTLFKVFSLPLFLHVPIAFHLLEYLLYSFIMFIVNYLSFPCVKESSGGQGSLSVLYTCVSHTPKTVLVM